MKRNKFIIIGLGSVGLELLKKLSRDFDVACIDINPETEETAKEIRSDCNVIIGDATSRLVLEDAGGSEADGIIITTTTEKINIEAARILKEHFESRRVLAIGTTKAGYEALEELGVEVENIFTASAIVIRNKLEQTSRAAHAIGLGKDEILEVEVHPHSRLANRSLRTLTPLRWRIGIIYRDNNIVMPGRDSMLRPRDKVVILGEPATLKTVSEILSFSFQRFPLEYGSTAISYLTGYETEDFFRELDYTFSALSLSKMIFLFSNRASAKSDFFDSQIQLENVNNVEVIKVAHSPLKAIEQTIRDLKGNQGLVILSKDSVLRSLFYFNRGMRSRRFLSSLMSISRCPVLLCSGTFPYEKTAVPSIVQPNLRHSLETAMEIAMSLNNEVTALLVNPSKYISSNNDLDEFGAIKKMINDMSSMYKISIVKKMLEGNPVKSITAILPEYNLLIADVGKWLEHKWIPQFLNPDVLWNIVRDAPISTLLLPVVEEFL